MKKTTKNRLFIAGDSWGFNLFQEPNWVLNNLPKDIEKRPSHFTEYLEKHYEVINFAFGAVSNTEIIYQLGNLPNLEHGDRLIIILTHHTRFNIWDKEGIPLNFGDFSYYFVQNKLYDNNWYPETPILNSIEGRVRLFLEDINELDGSIKSQRLLNEVKFLGGLKNLYSNYNPIVCTWDETISKKCKVEFIGYDAPLYENYKKLKISDEYGGTDAHLGGTGNYLLYKYFISKLDDKIIPLPEYSKTII